MGKRGVLEKMTDIFNADSARELMKKIEDNPNFLDALVRIKSAARHGYNTVTIDAINSPVEIQLVKLGFNVETYQSNNGEMYTKIDWRE